MRKAFFLALLTLSAPAFPQTSDSQTTKELVVEPSKDIKYPKESDILNRTNLTPGKPQTAVKPQDFSSGYTPSGGKLLTGWYLQVLAEGTEAEVQTQAEKLRISLPGQEVYIQKLDTGWRILTGPLGPTLIEKSLKAATALGLKDPTLRRER